MSIFNQNKGGRSLAWSGHRLPKPATRVQIPVAAPRTFSFGEKRTFTKRKIVSESVLSCLGVFSCDLAVDGGGC